VRDGVTGRIVRDEEFAAAIAEVLADPARHTEMRLAARSYALTMSWDSVFEGIYAAYDSILPVREQS
jgi:glycosyltransferase involved in cell wall biosynthesis